MRALAILGPNAHAADVRPFQLAGVELATADRVRSSERADAALIFGGDGSVHHQLAALVESQMPLLAVPTGSGNDFADAIGIRSVADSRSAWKRFCSDGGNVRTLDLGVITETRNTQREARNFFCCVAGAGMDAEANRRANAMPRWLRAHGGYALGVVGAVVSFRPQVMRVTFCERDGASRVIEEPATMVAVGNAPSYGRGMCIAPRAQLDDGLLDVCFVRRVPKLRLLRFFPSVYSGAHLNMAEVEYAQTTHLTIETDPPLPFHADGEYICRTPVELSAAPGALRTICNL